jgi:Xaa-Pro aminopeptidase
MTRLIIASSESSADILYAAGCFVPDDFIWIDHGGMTHAILSPLEIDRFRKTSPVDRVHSLKEIEERIFRKKGVRPGLAEVASVFLKKLKVRQVEVPASFPLGYAQALAGQGIRTKARAGLFFPQREIKTAREARCIEKTLRMAEAGLERGIGVLRASKAGPGRRLHWGGAPLTSERLRGEIDATIIKLGGLPAHTIVAGGGQACDPHERGHGPLKAGETIILDIFPRDQGTGYFGDLTRTVVKGKASPAIRHLYTTVQLGKRLALEQIRPGADGKRIHEGILDFFTKAGYPTKQIKGRWAGFFHGTGHSLGLEIHEAPRFSATRFPKGLAMTVEPGLYIPGLGGVRLEDLVLVTAGGCRNLTVVPEVLEIS